VHDGEPLLQSEADVAHRLLLEASNKVLLIVFMKTIEMGDACAA
jgi:hypothetical protein